MRRAKKSKYKSVVIKKKRYYFYKITWVDITGDSGHATEHDFCRIHAFSYGDSCVSVQQR